MTEHVIREGEGITEPTHIPTASPNESQSQHAPLPWRAGHWAETVIAADDRVVLECASWLPHKYDAANAAFVVRCVNSHDDLLASLKAVVAVLRREAPGTPLNNHKYDALGVQALAAIAKAEGR